MNFRDVLRCTLKTQEQANNAVEKTKSQHAASLLNRNEDIEVSEPPENMNAFALALWKLKNSNNKSSTKNNNMHSRTTQEINKPSTSTAPHAKLAGRSITKCTVPELDEFAKQKQIQAKDLEKKLETVIDKSMQYINNVSSSQRCEDDDDMYEKTIRETLRSVPFDNIGDFVTNIHIIISSFKDQH